VVEGCHPDPRFGGAGATCRGDHGKWLMSGKDDVDLSVGDAADGLDKRVAGCPARRDGSAFQGRSPVRARPGAAERSGAALIQ
jgi:hypothetical protein